MCLFLFFFPKQFRQEEIGSTKFNMSHEHFDPMLCFISNIHQLKHPKSTRCPLLCTYGDFYFPSKYNTWNKLLSAGGLQCFKEIIIDLKIQNSQRVVKWNYSPFSFILRTGSVFLLHYSIKFSLKVTSPWLNCKLLERWAKGTLFCLAHSI